MTPDADQPDGIGRRVTMLETKAEELAGKVQVLTERIDDADETIRLTSERQTSTTTEVKIQLAEVKVALDSQAKLAAMSHANQADAIGGLKSDFQTMVNSVRETGLVMARLQGSLSLAGGLVSFCVLIGGGVAMIAFGKEAWGSALITAALGGGFLAKYATAARQKAQ